MKLNLYVLSAKRTPVGTFMGSFKNVGPVELGHLSADRALADAQVAPEDFAHVIYGNVCSSSAADAPYLARHIGLRAGLPQAVPALTVNRLCGSGFEAIVQASSYVNTGPCLVGGAENMSLTPLMLRNMREGFKFAQPPASVDSLWEALNDRYAKMSMGQTAENLANEYQISRQECDEWSMNSHHRAAKAHEQGLFSEEMFSVKVSDKLTLDRDEHMRPDSSMEKLAKLRPVFGGVTTAGNASGMNDAAASLVVSDEAFAKKWAEKAGRQPLARVVGVKVVGCDPARMGIGPVEAIQGLVGELGWSIQELDYLEVNEAFAAQVLAVKKALGLSDAELNPHGSGISLGHPLGATGARISAHIAHLIHSGSAKRAIGSACIGGGQGIAVAFEAVSL